MSLHESLNLDPAHRLLANGERRFLRKTLLVDANNMFHFLRLHLLIKAPHFDLGFELIFSR